MAITQFEINEMCVTRNRVLNFLQQEKASSPNYKVIDVGGCANSWADEYVDAYVDVQKFETNKMLFVGNICESQVWNEIVKSTGKFDFSICTHVLEDVRDPLFVARGLMSISKAGFISMPNKHTEFSNVESSFYLGYCHHRWIFTIQSEYNLPHLVAIAKLPIVNYWNERISPFSKFIHFLGKNSLLQKVNRRMGFVPGVGSLSWISPEMVAGSKELGFQWQDDFEFKIINNDYAGNSYLELANLYITALEKGI